MVCSFSVVFAHDLLRILRDKLRSRTGCRIKSVRHRQCLLPGEVSKHIIRKVIPLGLFSDADPNPGKRLGPQLFYDIFQPVMSSGASFQPYPQRTGGKTYIIAQNDKLLLRIRLIEIADLPQAFAAQIHVSHRLNQYRFHSVDHPAAATAAGDAQSAVERKPMLVGVPIEGPSKPVPEPEPEEETVADRHFYRPEPRNVYTPTPEQIEEATHRPKRHWLWILLGAVAVGALVWLLARGGGEGKVDEQQPPQIVVADTLTDEQVQQIEMEKKAEAEKAEESRVNSEEKVKKAVNETIEKDGKGDSQAKADKPEKPADTGKPGQSSGEVTDVVTSQIVLTTLSEKHYGSPWFWVYIYEENVARGIIHDPNNIRPGTKVVIPPASKYGIDPKDKAALRKAVAGYG